MTDVPPSIPYVKLYAARFADNKTDYIQELATEYGYNTTQIATYINSLLPENEITTAVGSDAYVQWQKVGYQRMMKNDTISKWLFAAFVVLLLVGLILLALGLMGGGQYISNKVGTTLLIVMGACGGVGAVMFGVSSIFKKPAKVAGYHPFQNK